MTIIEMRLLKKSSDSWGRKVYNTFLCPKGGVPACRLLLITQALSLLQALVLTALVLTHTIVIWHIVVLSIFLGLVNAFDIPTRQAFTVEMIKNRQDLGNAIALNSSMVNAARLLGPSIGGILISLVGEGVCFFLNALSYLAVIISLCMLRITSKRPKTVTTRVGRELKEGFAYAFGFAPIKYILFLLALISLMGVPYQVLMPFFCKRCFSWRAADIRFSYGDVGLRRVDGRAVSCRP